MTNKNPLLLIDNSEVITLINEGSFECRNLTFEEATVILETYGEDVICCLNNPVIEDIIFDYLGIANRAFVRKHIINMRPSQDAIAFKILRTPSESQPLIHIDGVEAKKIQNVYIYCQLIMRTK